MLEEMKREQSESHKLTWSLNLFNHEYSEGERKEWVKEFSNKASKRLSSFYRICTFSNGVLLDFWNTSYVQMTSS